MQDPVEIGSDTEDFLGNEDESQTIPDEGEIDDTDNESAPTASEKEAQLKREPLPSIKQLEEAMVDLEKLLRPPRCDKKQMYKDPGFDQQTDLNISSFQICHTVFTIHGCISKRTRRRQAAWAAKKYRGHRVIPASLLADLEKAPK